MLWYIVSEVAVKTAIFSTCNSVNPMKSSTSNRAFSTVMVIIASGANKTEVLVHLRTDGKDAVEVTIMA